jgi:hypothetical protein
VGIADQGAPRAQFARAVTLPRRLLKRLPGRPARSVSYDDLIELARLCLKQAGSTSNPTAAAELRRMASEYQARAAALDEAPHMPNIAAAFESSPQGAQPSQQQQQPQPNGLADGGKDNGAPD